MPLDLLPATFACAPVGRQLSHRLGPYQGYARADSPNRPVFPFEEAERIVEDWKTLPPPSQRSPRGGRYEAHYNSLDKAFWFYDAEADEWYTWKGEDIGLALLYPIGEGAWKWECRS